MIDFKKYPDLTPAQAEGLAEAWAEGGRLGLMRAAARGWAELTYVMRELDEIEKEYRRDLETVAAMRAGLLPER